MANRRLTEQQRRRIEGSAEQRANAITSDGDTDETGLGIVIARFSKSALVMLSDGSQVDCHLRPNLPMIVAGDQISWQCEGDDRVATARLERRSELNRPNARGHLKPVAANVDLIAIVFAPFPEPFPNLIDRYLVAAHHADIEPLIVLNKADLLTADDIASQLLERYKAIGYQVAKTDPSEASTRDLTEVIGDTTTVFVGQSGVGKSSIIQRLIPDRHLRVGELSEGVQKGRHTTTTTEVFSRADGGLVIDSPGIREFGLGHVAAESVAPGFREFQPFLGHCRFRDCSHQHEAECAILEAIESGQISAERYQSYLLIVGQAQD